jgi:hypothetical protein
MAAPEFMLAGEFTALGFTVAADFMAAGSMARLVGFTAGLLDFPMAAFTVGADFMAGLLDFPMAALADFTAASFTLTDFTKAGFITMASAAA